MFPVLFTAWVTSIEPYLIVLAKRRRAEFAPRLVRREIFVRFGDVVYAAACLLTSKAAAPAASTSTEGWLSGGLGPLSEWRVSSMGFGTGGDIWLKLLPNGEPIPLRFHERLTDANWSVYERGQPAQARLIAPELVRRLALPAKARTLLDSGGGHGLYAMEFCARDLELRGSTILDLPGAINTRHPYPSDFRVFRGEPERLLFPAMRTPVRTTTCV